MLPKIAMVGCGYWGKNLLRNFQELNALTLVCDPCASGLALAGLLAPDVKQVNDFEYVLGEGIDAVVIATPAETHFELASRALAAGKDVFVEKPLAINYADGARLVELAEAKQSILMVGHVLEYHPGITRLVQLVREGALGKVQYIYSNRLSLGKIRREENILWSFAPHDIAVILRIMGAMPFQVVACGGNYVQPNIADVTVTNLLFDNGVRAHIFVSWLHPFKEQRLVIVGSEKMATFDDVTKKLSLYDQKVVLNEGEPTPIKSNAQFVEYSEEEPLRIECQAFLDAVANRTQPLTDGRSGLSVLKVLQSAQRSLIMNGQQVTVAPQPTNGHGRKRLVETQYENLNEISDANLLADAEHSEVHIIHE